MSGPKLEAFELDSQLYENRHVQRGSDIYFPLKPSILSYRCQAKIAIVLISAVMVFLTFNTLYFLVNLGVQIRKGQTT